MEGDGRSQAPSEDDRCGCRQSRCFTLGTQPGFVSVKSGLALRVLLVDGPNVAHLCFLGSGGRGITQAAFP